MFLKTTNHGSGTGGGGGGGGGQAETEKKQRNEEEEREKMRGTGGHCVCVCVSGYLLCVISPLFDVPLVCSLTFFIVSAKMKPQL